MVHNIASILPPGFASHALQMLQRVQHGISPIELVHTAHERWPLRPGHTIDNHAHSTLRISVLDSSFNPPTLAHLALANLHPPSTYSQQGSPVSHASAEPYDAQMLLLSVRNADKVLKPGDATFIQRLELMRLLSSNIHSTAGSSNSPRTNGNVAIAIIDEPTFVGKSTILLRFLRERLATVTEYSNSRQGILLDRREELHTLPSPKLTFLLGFDTLVRLFSPKYYPSEQAMISMLRACFSPELEDCRIACAYRQYGDSDNKIQETPHKTFEVADELIRRDRIVFFDIGTEEQSYSSSEVRAKVAARDERWKELVTHVIACYIIEQGLYPGLKGKEK